MHDIGREFRQQPPVIRENGKLQRKLLKQRLRFFGVDIADRRGQRADREQCLHMHARYNTCTDKCYFHFFAPLGLLFAMRFCSSAR